MKPLLKGPWQGVAGHLLTGFSCCARLDNRGFYEGHKYLLCPPPLVRPSMSHRMLYACFFLGPKLGLLDPLASQKGRDLGLLESHLKLCRLVPWCVEEFISYLGSSVRVEYREVRCLIQLDGTKRQGMSAFYYGGGLGTMVRKIPQSKTLCSDAYV